MRSVAASCSIVPAFTFSSVSKTGFNNAFLVLKPFKIRYKHGISSFAYTPISTNIVLIYIEFENETKYWKERGQDESILSDI